MRMVSVQWQSGKQMSVDYRNKGIFLYPFYFNTFSRINFSVVFLLLVSLFVTPLKGQDRIFEYDYEYKPNVHKDSIITEKMVLDVSNNSSVFRTLQDKKSDSLITTTGFGLGRKMTFENQLYVFVDHNDKEIIKSIQTIYKDLFFIKIIENLDWKISPEKKSYGNIEVQKAQVNYGGREWIAWFASDIPILFGPYVFNGLPGLIVEINDVDNNFSFKLTKSKSSEGKLYVRKKGVQLSWEHFKKLCVDYYSDPLAVVKQSGAPYKVDDGKGGAIAPDMKIQTDRIRKMIIDYNNPIELDHKIEYQ